MSGVYPDVLCVICARGGSKGIPGKNIKPIGGKPLIAHTIEDALEWDKPADIIVSTDSSDIAAVAEAHGADIPFERPAALATDEAAKLPAVQHAVETVEKQRDIRYEYVIDLDPTVPLRSVDDIEDAYQLVQQNGVENAQTVVEPEWNPYYNMFELNNDGYAVLVKEPDERIVRRQDAPSVYAMVGSVAAYERDPLLEADTILFGEMKLNEVPPKRSFPIDRPYDLAIAEALLEYDWEEKQ
jgi:N-acylneuraminate cytidylyltransferase/CMP-N,N'-diacetyllegionaminic acid synthase